MARSRRDLGIAYDPHRGQIIVELPPQYPGPPNIKFDDYEMTWVLSGVRSTAADENGFFENKTYCPGIALLAAGRTGNPHEHLAEYERVLDQVRRVAPLRVPLMHKGTPYYVMGWLAYKIRDFERCAFYMDAALAEDIANNPVWDGTPAAAFMFLDPNHPDATAREIVYETRGEMDRQISRYTAAVGSAFSTQRLIDRFVRPGAQNPTHRSIVTALLTFTLEGKDRLLQMDIRSSTGGTLEPFLTHLFKGGPIYESILKSLYHGTTGGAATLGHNLHSATVRAGLGISLHNPLYASPHRPQTFPGLLTALPTWAGCALPERSVAVVYATRNTSGHDLAWPANLDRTNYLGIYEGILDAIFWVVEHGY